VLWGSPLRRPAAVGGQGPVGGRLGRAQGTRGKDQRKTSGDADKPQSGARVEGGPLFAEQSKREESSEWENQFEGGPTEYFQCWWLGKWPSQKRRILCESELGLRRNMAKPLASRGRHGIAEKTRKRSATLDRGQHARGDDCKKGGANREMNFRWQI